MRTRTGYSMILLFLLVACRGPLIQGSGSGARIRPEGPLAERVRQIVAEYETQVVGILGTRYDREYVIEILPEDDEVVGEVNRPSRRLRIGKRGIATDEDLTRTVIHELVHVHAVGLWEEGPDLLEDGLAYLVAALLMGDLDQLSGGPPTVNECLEVLTLDYQRDYLAATLERSSELTRNALCLAYLLLRHTSAERFSEARWRPILEQTQLKEQGKDGMMLLRPATQKRP